MITTEHTVWCDTGNCQEWTQLNERLMSQTKKVARAMGWRYKAGVGWVCPKCGKTEVKRPTPGPGEPWPGVPMRDVQ